MRWLTILASIGIPSGSLGIRIPKASQSIPTGKGKGSVEKKGTPSAEQSCRSIHQKMETNFLSVVVAVDAPQCLTPSS